jgi:hypothetical protein
MFLEMTRSDVASSKLKAVNMTKLRVNICEVKMSSRLPLPLKDKEFASRLFRENFKQWFFEPRHWRLTLEDIKTIDIQFLNFSPPQYDFMILITLRNGETLQFYEGIIAKNAVEKAERAHGSTEIGRSTVYFVDGYTNKDYIENLLEAWCRRKKLDSLGFAGQFLEAGGESHVQLETLKPLFKSGEAVTTNYLYRYDGWIETSESKKNFSVLAKRFLPREPPTRGNHEYAMLRALPSNIVPKSYGGVVNRRLKANAENQLLVLFEDYLEGAVEIGKQIWDLMKRISQKKVTGMSADTELKRLYRIVEEAIDQVVFPFHQAGFEAWHAAGVVVTSKDEYYKWYHKELEQNLNVLKTAKAVTADQSENLSKIFRGAWNQILGKTKITEIHGDLMWRQILRTKDKRLIILDLDEHIAGHAAKDLAGLCAANRFIAENLQSPQREYLRNVAEQLNTIILESYMRNAERSRAMWAENLEKTVAVYLAYRHLHDAAYYAPVWRQARKQVDLKRYKRYVDFSLGWLEESLKLVKNHLNLE